MRRRILTFLLVSCLLLLIASFAVWVGSYFEGLGVSYPFLRQHQGRVQVLWVRGALACGVAWVNGDWTAIQGPPPPRPPVGGGESRAVRAQRRRAQLEAAAWLSQRRFVVQQLDEDRKRAPLFVHGTPSPDALPRGPTFQLDSFDKSTGNPNLQTGKFIVCFPLWFPPMLAGGASLILWELRGRRPLPFHCVRCGYDLRATPERCPECGAVPEGRQKA